MKILDEACKGGKFLVRSYCCNYVSAMRLEVELDDMEDKSSFKSYHCGGDGTVRWRTGYQSIESAQVVGGGEVIPLNGLDVY